MQSAEYATFVGKLGLTEAIAQLKTANDDFNAIYAGRSGEKLTRVSADNMKAIRPKVDDAYRAVVSAINALYQVNELVTLVRTRNRAVYGWWHRHRSRA